jgi:serine/threonine protein phosphatase PrpC
LWRALGQIETVDVDFRREQVAPNSYLLLCTDGLISLDAELTEAELLPAITDNEPQTACNRLVELAQKYDSTDDITAMVIKIHQR